MDDETLGVGRGLIMGQKEKLSGCCMLMMIYHSCC